MTVQKVQIRGGEPLVFSKWGNLDKGLPDSLRHFILVLRHSRFFDFATDTDLSAGYQLAGQLTHFFFSSLNLEIFSAKLGQHI